MLCICFISFICFIYFNLIATGFKGQYGARCLLDCGSSANLRSFRVVGIYDANIKRFLLKNRTVKKEWNRCNWKKNFQVFWSTLTLMDAMLLSSL